MNKKISSHWSLGLIIFLAIVSASYIWVSANEPIGFDVANTIKRDALANKNACQARVFEGSAEIEVWKVVENGKSFLRVSPENYSQLPLDQIREIQLIDPTPEIKEKLTESSEEKPVTIEISGLATLCEGVSLVSLNYKEGIFRPYIF